MKPLLPDSFYWSIGALIFMNLSLIVTIIVMFAKGIWWVSKLDSRVEKNTKDVNAAHRELRDFRTVRNQ